ncbi:hypothetical protein B2G74_04440 [Burkholderia sp. A27]|nr:hypothetical protein B2G74_04440 [Burkholderia sp. A27]
MNDKDMFETGVCRQDRYFKPRGAAFEYRTSGFVKVYSMPAIGRRNVHAAAHVGRRRINPMEETAECPDAVGGFAAMAIDRLGCSVVSDATRPGGMPDGR